MPYHCTRIICLDVKHSPFMNRTGLHRFYLSPVFSRLFSRAELPTHSHERWGAQPVPDVAAQYAPRLCRGTQLRHGACRQRNTGGRRNWTAWLLGTRLLTTRWRGRSRKLVRVSASVSSNSNVEARAIRFEILRTGLLWKKGHDVLWLSKSCQQAINFSLAWKYQNRWFWVLR